MRTRTKALLAAAALLLAAGLSGWLWRVELLLAGVEVLADRRTLVGPTRQVHWQQGPAAAQAPAAERPPNILLILADDLGWNDLSFNGGGLAGGRVKTPHIDSIAAEGVNFTQGYAANATCAPSRAALLSGRYSTRFGFEFTPTPDSMMPMMRIIGEASGRDGPPVIHNEQAVGLAYEDMGMPPSEVTLAELLQGRGYHSVHIGKWHLGRSNGMAPQEQGFDESLLMTSGLYGRKDDPSIVQSRQDFDPIDLFLWRALKFAAQHNGGPVFEPPRYLTDYYTDEAVKVIEANKNRPFFLYLAHFAPHTPLQATEEDYAALPQVELHRERVYAAMIRALDRSVGRVLEALRQHGLEENSLVMFSSDNGGAGYLGLPEVNKPFRGWKMSLFEGGVHVPFFIKWPAKLPPGTIYDQPVHHFDLYASAAAAAGAALPADRKMDGVDLLPYVRKELDGAPHQALFWRSGASQSVRMGRWKLNLSAPEGLPRREWLFDLAEDPGERRNLAAQRQAKLAELRKALEAHNAQQKPPLWPSQLSSPVNIDRDLSQADAPGDEYAYWSN